MRPGVQTSTSEFSPAPPKATMKTTRPAMATTLLITGAQVKGPNTWRALSTSLSSEYIA
jgi:hypothetical protein